MTPDPGPAPGPCWPRGHVSKRGLFLPMTGRILNKPEEPLGRLPTCVPPVSIVTFCPQGGAGWVCQLLAPDWPEHGPVGMKTGCPQAFWGQCRGGQSGSCCLPQCSRVLPAGAWVLPAGARVQGLRPAALREHCRWQGSRGLINPRQSFLTVLEAGRPSVS